MKYAVVIILSLFQGVLLSSCFSKDSNAGLVNLQKQDSASLQINPSANDNLQGICSVDFANFTYPDPFDDEKATVVLKNGAESPKEGKTKSDSTRFNFAGVYYGDVTGDGMNEAIVTIDIQSGGSAMPRAIYVYQHRPSEPRLLWKFVSGDRANGGLRTLYSRDGNLIVEAYTSDEDGADCCPTSYEEITSRWNGKTFSEMLRKKLPNSTSGANFSQTPSSCK